jgi:preprotein translocase subunit Sec61beta
LHRFYQALLIVSTLGFSWLAMMLAHEAGHVLHAWLSGGSVDAVVLNPLRISQTQLDRNPHPLFVAWGGFAWGCALPLSLVLLGRCSAPQHAYLAQFFAGFCCVANGAYLAGGALLSVGDAADLLRQGALRWLLVLVGSTATAGGLALWNGLAAHFGGRASRGKVDPRAALGMAAAFCLLVMLELLFGAVG